MSSTLHGSAQWNTGEGAKSEDAFCGGNAFFGRMLAGGMGEISQDGFLAIDATRRHFLSIAPTRSGKGVSLIIPNLLLYRGSTITIDPKGENAWITAKYRREDMGQKTIILDPWNEVNRRYGEKAGELETVSCFNPLSILDPESENYADDLAYLADALIINQGKDPHWDDSARELVAGLIAFLVETPALRAAASLGTMRMMLSKPANQLREIAKEAQKLGPESVAARKLGRFVLDTGELNSIISTALTQTAFLDSAPLAKNLESSDFSFEDLLTGKGASVYLVLPVDKLQTYGRWLRLMVSIGIRTIARSTRKLPAPVLFMLDEFGTIGKLSAIEQAYGLMAGLQMTLWAFIQDLIQLKRDYPDSWETFIGNSQGVSFMNVMDQFTCDYLSKMLGTRTIEDLSVGTVFQNELRSGKTAQEIEESTDDPNLKGLAELVRYGTHVDFNPRNDVYHSRALLLPEEARIKTEHYGVLAGRSNPYLFKPVAYYAEPFFLRRARLDPHFPAMKEAKAKLDAEKTKLEAEAAQKARAEAAKENFETAKALLEKQGFKVKKAMFGGKITVTPDNGKPQTFADYVAFMDFAEFVFTRPDLEEAKEAPGQQQGSNSFLAAQSALEKQGIRAAWDSGKITVTSPDGAVNSFADEETFFGWAKAQFKSGGEEQSGNHRED